MDCVPNPKSCGGTGGCSGATVELAMSYVAWSCTSRILQGSPHIRVYLGIPFL